MPLLFIHAVNAEFDSRDDGIEYETPEIALNTGVQAALAMAGEEIIGGRTSAAVEIRVERADGTAISRSVVSICVAPLLTRGAAGPSMP